VVRLLLDLRVRSPRHIGAGAPILGAPEGKGAGEKGDPFFCFGRAEGTGRHKPIAAP